MSATRRIDHDQVLGLWALGHDSVEIARLMSLKGSETARTIVGRARMRGDPRALSRGPAAHPTEASPTEVHLLVLPSWLAASATVEAKRRELPLDEFCLRLLGTCVREGLIQAVLDDASDGQPSESDKEA
jgi:hypothetical protein